MHLVGDGKPKEASRALGGLGLPKMDKILCFFTMPGPETFERPPWARA